MKKMKNNFYLTTTLLLAITFSVFNVNAQNKLSKKEITQGWILLFNGKDFDGWRGINQKEFPQKGWDVKNNCIVNTGENGGSIITTKMYADFEFEWEWKMPTPGSNSGVKYFVVEREGDSGGYGYGIEYQMLDDKNHEWMLNGNMKPNDYHTLGAAYELYSASPEKKPKKPGKWNKSKIVSNNGNIEHWLNGKKILEYNRFSSEFAEKVKASKFKDVKNFGIHKKGHILLQDHNHEVYFRNLKIKVL